MSAIWILLILMPHEGSGRQVGPFATEAQCVIARDHYNSALRSRIGPQSVCVQAIAQGGGK